MVSHGRRLFHRISFWQRWSSRMIFALCYCDFHIITVTIPFCYARMYGRFANAEDERGFTDGVFGFDDIFSEADSPIPCVFFQK